MASTAGARLKLLRTELGLPRYEFSQLVKIENLRLITIENEKGRMSTDDLELVVRALPNTLEFLVLGTPIGIEALENSDNLHLKKLALNLKLQGKTMLSEVK